MLTTCRSWLRALAVALLAAPPAAHAQPVKVGFVYVSPVGDVGWTHQHDEGRKAMEKALAGRVETHFVANVPEGPDAERVMREMAAGGDRIVFATSFGYMNASETVAKQFPGVVFMHAAGYKRGKNLGTYNARFYEGRYLTGIVAGRMTKSNVLGYVAAFPIPEVLQGINAFTRGARSVNPKVQVRVIWTNSWFDPGRERDAANTLLGQNADVLTHHTESPAVVQAAEAKGRWSIGYHSDMSKYGPKSHLTAAVHQWGAFYTKAVGDVIGGVWKSGDTWGGIRDGMITLAPFNTSVPVAVKDEVAKTEAEIRSGRFHPFTGPVRDQDGNERVPPGRTMADDEIGRMNFLVDGVTGKVPKN